MCQMSGGSTAAAIMVFQFVADRMTLSPVGDLWTCRHERASSIAVAAVYTGLRNSD
jgi:hypothetical protein